MYSDYVVVVEGPTDRTLLYKEFMEDNTLCKCIENKILTVRSIGGIHNLKSEIYAIQRYCCNYIILLDYDNAGKDAANNIKQTLSVPDSKIRYFMKSKNGEFELEDLYNPEMYSQYLLQEGFDISNCLTENGYQLLCSICNKIKKDLEEMSLI